MMAVIPDTGGGLSGFIAHGLWKLYQYFPSSGRWDWLLLVFLLAVLVRVLYLPLLWKSVKADMDLLREGGACVSRASWLTWIWDVGSAFFLVWFFHTAAGRTFLAGRSFGPDVVAAGLFWLSWGWNACVGGGAMELAKLLDARDKAIGLSCSAPYADRGLLSLFGGGGVFFNPAEEGKKGKLDDNAPPVGIKSAFFFLVYVLRALFNPAEEGEKGPFGENMPPVGMESAFFVLAHMFYWYWSVVSVTIFSAFILSGVLTEIVRMVFVYILHRRVFG